MGKNHIVGKYELRSIASRAMLQRGLLPEFSAEVLEQTNKITSAATESLPDIRDLRKLLWASIDNDDLRDLDQLTTLATHCTVQEDNAAKVERQMRKSAAALLLTPRIGAHFDAIVTGASEKGTWVRVSGPTAEGRVVRGFEGLDVGDRVRVELVHTDIARGFIDFTRTWEQS